MFGTVIAVSAMMLLPAMFRIGGCGRSSPATSASRSAPASSTSRPDDGQMVTLTGTVQTQGVKGFPYIETSAGKILLSGVGNEPASTTLNNHYACVTGRFFTYTPVKMNPPIQDYASPVQVLKVATWKLLDPPVIVQSASHPH
jgi:hypothetical protein